MPGPGGQLLRPSGWQVGAQARRRARMQRGGRDRVAGGPELVASVPALGIEVASGEKPTAAGVPA